MADFVPRLTAITQTRQCDCLCEVYFLVQEIHNKEFHTYLTGDIQQGILLK